MTDCREVLEHLSEYLDEELEPSVVNRIAEHLASCSNCDEAKQRLLRSIEACRTFKSAEQPRDLPQSIRDELRASYLRVRASSDPGNLTQAPSARKP
jgi:predicted anti-sigma-YlaC factor YlaD